MRFPTRSCLLLLAAGLCASATATATNVYQWKDAKGVTHYSDKPPAGEQFQERRIDPRGEPVPQGEPAGKAVENPQCTQVMMPGTAPASGVSGSAQDGPTAAVIAPPRRARRERCR